MASYIRAAYVRATKQSATTDTEQVTASSHECSGKQNQLLKMAYNSFNGANEIVLVYKVDDKTIIATSSVELWRPFVRCNWIIV